MPRDRLYDEDGIDGPFERGMARASRGYERIGEAGPPETACGECGAERCLCESDGFDEDAERFWGSGVAIDDEARDGL